MTYCPNCGSTNPENAAFCANCGKQLNDSSTAPQPVRASEYTTSAASAGALDENIAGMLAYFTFIPAIIFLLVEPYRRNRFVRFHCLQCIFLAIAFALIDVILSIFTNVFFHIIPLLGSLVGLLWPLWGLAELAIWLLLVVKAYQHAIFKLPVVGDLAEKYAIA